METSYFTIFWWVLPYIIKNQPWVHMCPSILNPPPTSLPTHSLWVIPGHQLLSALLHPSNLRWLSILHMVIYMFQCYSLKSFHPHLLPHSPKVCSLHACLFCCLAYRIVITVFLNYTYKHYILYWCFSFWWTSLYIGLVQSFSHVQLFVTPWTTAHQASLSVTNSQTLLKLMYIKSVMPSNHLILWCPLLLLLSIFPSIGVFFNESVLHIR